MFYSVEFSLAKVKMLKGTKILARRAQTGRQIMQVQCPNALELSNLIRCSHLREIKMMCTKDLA